MAKKNVKAGMNKRKDALVDMQTVSARRTTVRGGDAGVPYGTPSRGRREFARIGERMTDDDARALRETRRVIRRRRGERIRFGRTRRRTRSRSGWGSMGRVRGRERRERDGETRRGEARGTGRDWVTDGGGARAMIS